MSISLNEFSYHANGAGLPVRRDPQSHEVVFQGRVLGTVDAASRLIDRDGQSTPFVLVNNGFSTHLVIVS